MTDSNSGTIEISESDLYELYDTLAAATEAAATGDPNECASLAAEAKDRVIKIHEEATNASD